MKKSIFVVGDLHGCKENLDEVLKSWKRETEQLILLGDLIDRGPDSLGCILTAMKLQEEYGAIILKGNHEAMFLQWLDMPHSYAESYFRNGGRETLSTFLPDYEFKYLTEVADYIKREFSREVEFLRNLPLYHETDSHIFVHAGVDLILQDWRESGEDDFLWIREPFHKRKNKTGKIIIFGHTPTPYLHHDDNNCDVWVSPCKTKIGIDGGAVFGGYLHALRISEAETIRFSA
ncbi:metallophosphoesterase family protein [Bacillus thuringiensis]|uniref:metallophosphoesterase family protein n=1 Tax=Bacillus thuringiensis TaxID=1428 RepID=UPI00119E650C|nr:metallophosphoesterase family protein [Bacillus thuringiensis]